VKAHWVAAISILTITMLGCTGQTPPSSFYALSGPDVAPPGTDSARGELSIGLGPVELPVVLERPQIVTRPDTNRLALSEFDRWGGELSSEVPRALAQNLMAELGTDRVAAHPWPRYRKIDYQVVIDVFRFDGEPGREVVLEGVWTLVRGDGIEELEVHGFRETIPVASDSYEALVAALSSALGRLSSQIAERITQRSEGHRS